MGPPLSSSEKRKACYNFEESVFFAVEIKGCEISEEE